MRLKNWAGTHTKYLNQGRGSMCNFRHIKRGIKLTVHGDDFLVVADEEEHSLVEQEDAGGVRDQVPRDGPREASQPGCQDSQ